MTTGDRSGPKTGLVLGIAIYGGWTFGPGFWPNLPSIVVSSILPWIQRRPLRQGGEDWLHAFRGSPRWSAFPVRFIVSIAPVTLAGAIWAIVANGRSLGTAIFVGVACSGLSMAAMIRGDLQADAPPV